MAAEDYYQLLGISREASDDEIRKAYKKAALKYHPDKNPNNAEAEHMFKKIAEAYDVLQEKDKRRIYDLYGEVGLKSGAGAGGFSSDGAAAFGGVDPMDIFSRFFGAEGMESMHVGGGNNAKVHMFRSDGRGGGGMSFSFGGSGRDFDMGDGDLFSQMFHGARNASSSDDDGLAIGSLVIIQGLRAAAHLNGCSGTIVGQDPDSGRLQVQVDGSVVAVRPENVAVSKLQRPRKRRSSIDPFPTARSARGRANSRESSTPKRGTFVQIINTNRPDLDGVHGEVFSFDEGSRTYNVRIGGARAVSLPPANLMYLAGTLAIIEGLVSATQFNNAKVEISKLDSATGRYEVNLPNGTFLKIRPENLRVETSN